MEIEKVTPHQRVQFDSILRLFQAMGFLFLDAPLPVEPKYSPVADPNQLWLIPQDELEQPVPADATSEPAPLTLRQYADRARHDAGMMEMITIECIADTVFNIWKRELLMLFDQRCRGSFRNEQIFPMGVVVFDVNHLKKINSRYGKQEANRAIYAIFDRVRKIMETRQSVQLLDWHHNVWHDPAGKPLEILKYLQGRGFNGDEFVMLLPYCSKEELGILMHRLSEALDDISRFELRCQRTGRREVAIVSMTFSYALMEMGRSFGETIYQLDRENDQKKLSAPTRMEYHQLVAS